MPLFMLRHNLYLFLISNSMIKLQWSISCHKWWPCFFKY